MAQNDPTYILFDTGRLVQGSLYEQQDKDMSGKPLTVKSGPNIGQPTKRSFFAVAIPKVAGHTHWSQTTWGSAIWNRGHADFPQGHAQRPDFAWKIEDGDEQIPRGDRMTKNCDRPGFPGHWVVKFGGQFLPKIVKLMPDKTTAEFAQVDGIKLGDFIQVYGSVVGNGETQKPGVYVNFDTVCFIGYGERITFGIDPSKVGFGGGAMPAGVSAAPVASMMPQVPQQAAYAPPAAPAAPVAPPMAAPVPVAPTVAPAAPVAPVAVAPNHAILNHAAPVAPPAPPAPVPPAPVAAGPQFVMTATAGAFSREQYLSSGWTDDSLIAAGMMVRVG